MDDWDSNLDKGGFLILPATGMTLIGIGIFIIIVAYYPDIIPFILSATLPQEMSSFLIGYYIAFTPEMLPHPYMVIIGLGCIGGGSAIMLIEYRAELRERAYSK